MLSPCGLGVVSTERNTARDRRLSHLRLRPRRRARTVHQRPAYSCLTRSLVRPAARAITANGIPRLWRCGSWREARRGRPGARTAPRLASLKLVGGCGAGAGQRPLCRVWHPAPFRPDTGAAHDHAARSAQAEGEARSPAARRRASREPPQALARQESKGKSEGRSRSTGIGARSRAAR
jgi:hypothetical protein